MIRIFFASLIVSGVVFGYQTGKVYEADYALLDLKGIHFIQGRDKAGKYLNKVFNDPWFKKNYNIKKPLIIREESNSKLTSAIGPTVANGNGTISVPDRGCFNFNILHEVAHHIKPQGAHEKEFTKMYLILIDHFVNPEAANELRKSFKRLGVQY